MYYYPNNAATPAYMQPQLSNTVPQTGCNNLKGRPVSSLEEVRAAQIDFDGSLFIFPDLAHNRIYTKQISMDGNASLNMYELTPIPTTQAVDNSNFVTREEFSNTMAQVKQVLAQIKGESVQPEETKTEPLQFNF